MTATAAAHEQPLGDGTKPATLIAVGVVALLVAVSARYGYHRDELYFLATGHHLAWGYPDQPPFVAAVARAVEAVAPRSLVVLRLPAALAAGTVVLLTALTARELRATKAEQVAAAGAMAVAAVLYGAGHQMGTTVFNLVVWAALVVMVLHVLRTDTQRWWPAVGVVAGAGLMNNTLVVFLAAAVGVSVLVFGPRKLLTSGWLWVGVAIAVALWLPYLDWQARHGWPQLAESRAIAAGKSGSSQPRSLFVPFQLLLVSPWLVPMWLAGLVRLLRDPALRWCRALGASYLVLTVVFIVMGGKPYYISGLYPLLLAAGAAPTLRWARERRSRRRWLVAAAVLSLPALLVTLPLLPQRSLAGAGVVSLNYDLGEQVGWPTYVEQVAAAYRTTSATSPAQIVTSNYGEAGAVDRYGGRLGLPHAYSGQTGYWWWGPPPESPSPVLAVGFSRQFLLRVFTDVSLVGRLDNHVGLDNDEQHQPLWSCTGRRTTWARAWRLFRST